MTHDVIDVVSRLVFLLNASFCHYFSHQCQVQTKWSKGSYTGRITTFQLTAATSSKIVLILLRLILEYFDMENTYRHQFWMLGKCNPLSQLREHDGKIQITHAEHHREPDYLFLNKNV